MLTDRHLAAPRPLTDVVERAVAGGARAVVVREKDLPPAERAALVATIAASVRPAGGIVLSASTSFPGADGIHLDARQPMPDHRPAVVGRSCHDLDEVRAAEAEGCDYVTLSPVFTTASKPGYGPPLGLAELSRVCAAVDIAVYALGGVLARHARPCIEAGAAGLAVMGAVMSAVRPEAATADLRRLLEPSATSGPRGKERHA